MPIFVDHEERRDQIITAAVAVLGDRGFARFTLRAVGQRLGGSVTLVTHYFPSRDALLDGLLQRTVAEARAMHDELLSIADPHDRLEAVVRYFLPLDEETMAIERARVALSSHRNVEPTVADHLEQIDVSMRELIRTVISGFITSDEVEAMVDLIRLWTAGVVLTWNEHPEAWTPERQLAATKHFMQVVNLPVSAA